MGQDLFNQADRLKCAQRLVVESDTARIVDEAVPLFDHEGANTLQAKDVGQRQADGPAPTMTMSHFSVTVISAPAGSPGGAR